MVKHLVAFVQHEHLDVTKAEFLLSHQGIKPPWGCDYDVRMSVFVGQDFKIFLHWSSTVENTSLQVRHIFAESCVFILDLVCKLTSVAHNEDRTFPRDWLDLLKGGENKNSCLSETRFGLAEHIGSQDRLGDTHLLYCMIMPMSDCQSQV